MPVLASAPMPTPKPATLPAPAPEPAKAEPVRPKAAETVRPVVPIPLSVASDASTVPAEPAPKTPPLSQRVSEFAITHWHWLLALLAVPLAAVGWAWRAHHLAYDKNGLPRGPRL